MLNHNKRQQEAHLFEVHTVGTGPALVAIITGIRLTYDEWEPFCNPIRRGMNYVTDKYGLPWQRFITWYIELDDGLHAIRVHTGEEWIRQEGLPNYYKEIQIEAQALIPEQYETIRRTLGKSLLMPKETRSPLTG